MTTPSPTVFVSGQGSVNADFLNGLIQGVATVAALRAFVGVSGMTIYLEGAVTAGDGGQGFYRWDSTATATDNGSTVIKPSGVSGDGAWIIVAIGTLAVQARRSITTGIASTSLGTDRVLMINTGGAYALTLVATPIDGQTLTVKAGSGVTPGTAITITSSGGLNIDERPDLVLDSANLAVTLIYNASIPEWNII